MNRMTKHALASWRDCAGGMRETVWDFLKHSHRPALRAGLARRSNATILTFNKDVYCVVLKLTIYVLRLRAVAAVNTYRK